MSFGLAKITQELIVLFQVYPLRYWVIKMIQLNYFYVIPEIRLNKLHYLIFPYMIYCIFISGCRL